VVRCEKKFYENEGRENQEGRGKKDWRRSGKVKEGKGVNFREI